ncbi:hypothetical protein GCM10010493_83920 [Streptomyces lavendulae subsp. grasserius]
MQQVRFSHTPAPSRAARRCQQVIPESKLSSWSGYFHWMPVCGANKIPHNACLPATSFRPGSRSNGSMGDHASSDTVHGRD